VNLLERSKRQGRTDTSHHIAASIKRVCGICSKEVDNCDTCRHEIIKYAVVLIAGLPISKVEYVWENEDRLEERFVQEYIFDNKLEGAGKLLAKQDLYETILKPYADHSHQIIKDGQSLFFAGDSSLGKQ